MAKRWVLGTLMGALLTGLMSAPAYGQTSPDPIPIGQTGGAPGAPHCWPGFGEGPAPVMDTGPRMIYRYPQIPPMPIAHPNPLGGMDRARDSGREDDSDFSIIVSAGYMPLWRSRMKDHVVAVADGVPFDDDRLAPVGSPVILTYRDVPTDLVPGYRLYVGFYHQDQIFELTGFHVQNNEEFYQVVRPGQVSSFFFNVPVGFEGTGQSLWDNADIMSLKFRHQLTNAEINHRCLCGSCGTELEFMIGVRYMDQSEKLEIFADDDSIQIITIPETQATLTSQTHNRMLGPQIGALFEQCLSGRLSVSCGAKVAVLANYASMKYKLERGDGLVGFDTGHSRWGIGAVSDTGVFLTLSGSRWRARVGYQAFWIYGLATAQDQVDFDLSNKDGRNDVSGSALYHGPAASLDILF